MHFSPEIKSNISKVGVITLVYVLISWFQVIFSYSLMVSPWSLGPVISFSIWNFLISATFTGLIAGIIGGTFMVLINSKLFRRKSFSYAMLATLLSYLMTFLIISIFIPILMVALQIGFNEGFGNIALNAVKANFSILLLTYFVLWGVIVMLTMFFLQINDKFGPGILFKFLIGKYHQPREEERIFMFMDMKSSTTIAEKIGNTKYFQMLQEVILDITDVIISCEGEIYQYVGDEIVVSWKMDRGIRNANCINCFLLIQKKLINSSRLYREIYGFVPEYRAGIHFGIVTAGEIGSIKKDIVYSGDVLNATSRIQEQCKLHGSNLLVSQQTLSLIPSDLNEYKVQALGEIELRGKEEKINLISVE